MGKVKERKVFRKGKSSFLTFTKSTQKISTHLLTWLTVYVIFRIEQENKSSYMFRKGELL